MTDPIADMLTRIRNAAAVNKKEVLVPFSTTKFSIAKIISKAGYIGKVEKLTTDTFPELKLELKYRNKNSVIRSIKRVSKPGRRVYSKSVELPHVLNNLGVAIISTSQGVMTNLEARKKKVGGEVICEIY